MAPHSPDFEDETLQSLMSSVRRKLAEQQAQSVAGSGGPSPGTQPLDAREPAAAAPTAPLSPPPQPVVKVAGETTGRSEGSLRPGADRRVAIGADHGGYELKCRLVELLVELGYEPYDVGTDSPAAVDYPDFAVKVAKTVARGEAIRGIMIDGAGIGSAMAAGKIPGVRAATCHNEATAVNSREHNDANLLVLGSGQVNRGLARRMVRIWLQTDFAGGRHARRVDKIKALDR